MRLRMDGHVPKDRADEGSSPFTSQQIVPSGSLRWFAEKDGGLVLLHRPSLSLPSVESISTGGEETEMNMNQGGYMTFSKVAFEITLFLSMTVFMVIAVTLVSLPTLAILPVLAHLLGVPLCITVVACATLGTWSGLTKQEWYGYIRAMCLLLGVIAAIPFSIATVYTLAHGAPWDELVNNAAVCGVGLAMIYACHALRRWSPTCMPQLKSLFTFSW